jgi:hypothetical protein
MALASYDPQASPADDLRDAIQQARRQHKNVLVELGGDWCVWCERLERFIETHEELRDLREQHYVTVKVFVSDSEPANLDFLRTLPSFDAVPHLLVYNGSGALLVSQATDQLEAGESYDYGRLRQFLREWSDWRRTPYDAVEMSVLRRRFEQLFERDDDGPVASA